MPSSTSPSMGLFLPIPGSTPGPQWASETTTNWSTLDTHDHTTGKGVQIPIAALNVNADFSWLTYGQTNVGYLSLVDKLATGNLTVNASLGNVTGDPYWRNAAGVVKKIGLAGDPLTLASGTSLLGSLLMTAIAAPGSPAAGFGSLYFDTTATNIAVKNSSGVVKHGVQTKAAVASQWLTSIADDGSSVLAQPAFSDISGSIVSGTAVAGSLLMTNIAAPSSPASGKVIAWADSTTRNWSSKDSFGNVSVSVVPLAATTSQWLTGVALNGVFSTAQPAYSDLSGSIPSGTGALGSLLLTNIAAPGTPAAGKVSLWTDSTTKAPSAKDDAGLVYVMPRINSGSSAGRAGIRELIELKTLSATATYTTVSWAAGKYRQIIIEVDAAFSLGGYLTIQFNADATAANYCDYGINNSGTPAGDNAFQANGYARGAVAFASGNFFHDTINIFPLTTGRPRLGNASSHSTKSSATSTQGGTRTVGFEWRNTATDVTFLTFGTQAGTLTGTAEVWGVLA